MGVIGTSRRRVEGEAKVRGSLRYTADLRAPETAHAKLLLSIHPHARVVTVDVSAARALPGVIDVVTGADLEVEAAGPDLPLARDRVFFVGQPVVAVVARDEATAVDARDLVQVEYEPLEAIVDPHEAIRPEAHTVLEEGAGVRADAGEHGAVVGETAAEDRPPNTTSMVRLESGDVDAAFARSDAVVRRTYRIPLVHQGFIETHVSVARVEPDGGVTIWTSTQGAFLVRDSVAETLRVPVNQVRVVPMPVGGGFGGKFGLLEPLAALLARRSGRTVQVALTRNEEFLMGRGGVGAQITVELGGTRDGRLTALRAVGIFDNGASAGNSAGIACRLIAGGGTYRIEAHHVEGLEVATNKTPVGAYRAPGAPQAYFALEQAVDELARELALDPIELRLRNAVREGDASPTGEPWGRIGLVEVLEAARSHPLWTAPLAPHEGVGCAVGGWPGGTEPAAAVCRVEPDGSLTLQLGSSDITGTNTGFAMMAAETLGFPLDKVRVETGDTGSAPYAGGAGGSKITYSVGPAVVAAAAAARRQLLEIAADRLEVAPEDLEIKDGRIQVRGFEERNVAVAEAAAASFEFGSAYAPVEGQGRVAVATEAPMFTVHIARVRFDPETGALGVVGYAAVQDVGRALNPAEVAGQIHGGVAQGLGRALGEELVYDADGQLRTASFVDYQLPTVDQVPPVDVELVEVPSQSGPFGARGVGEPPAVPGAAAVANALAAAAGVRLTGLPIDFEELQARLPQTATVGIG